MNNIEQGNYHFEYQEEPNANLVVDGCLSIENQTAQILQAIEKHVFSPKP